MGWFGITMTFFVGSWAGMFVLALAADFGRSIDKRRERRQRPRGTSAEHINLLNQRPLHTHS